MVSPCTVEDSGIHEVFDNGMNTIDTFLDLIGNEGMFDGKTRKDVLLYFISNFLNDPGIAEMLEDDKQLMSLNTIMKKLVILTHIAISPMNSILMVRVMNGYKFRYNTVPLWCYSHHFRCSSDY